MSGSPPRDARPSDEPLLTVPNVIAGARLLALAPMLWLAYAGYPRAFFWLMAALFVTDWIDGKLAKALDQETVFGARLDSAADWAMYSAIGIALWWLEADVIRDNAWLIAGVFATWGLSAAIALARFRRLPSYHNRAAKATWLVAALAAGALFLTDTAAVMPWAFGMAIVTNVDAAMIGLLLPEWRANVGSAVEAWGVRVAGSAAEDAGSVG